MWRKIKSSFLKRKNHTTFNELIKLIEKKLIDKLVEKLVEKNLGKTELSNLVYANLIDGDDIQKQIAIQVITKADEIEEIQTRIFWIW